MKQELERAEQVSMKELKQLDGDTERLTAEQSHLAKEKMEGEQKLEILDKQLESHKSLLENYNKVLETERRNLEKAEDTLNDMRRQRDNAQTVRDVGIGLLFIPIAGWIAGE